MNARRRVVALVLGLLCGVSACILDPDRPHDDPDRPHDDPDIPHGEPAEFNDRDLFTATHLTDGWVLVVGGVKDGEAQRTALLYDSRHERWYSAGLLTDGRSDHTATRLTSGKVLVLGGVGQDIRTGQGSRLSSAELYDPASGTWSLAAPMSRWRTGHQATLLKDGRVLVTGGGDADSSTASSVEVYDPATDRWSPCDSMRVSRRGHSARLLSDGRVLVTAGLNDRDGQGGVRTVLSAELYDPSTNTWTTTEGMRSPHSRHSSVLLPNDQVLVAGGELVATNEVYLPDQKTWRSVPVSNDYLMHCSATSLADGRVVVAGGFHDTQAVRSVSVYHADTFTWSSAAPLPTPRYSHQAVLLQDGRLLLLGGLQRRGQPATPHQVIYDPGTNTWK
jgi:N-acetylneuraminic acid mutarotase